MAKRLELTPPWLIYYREITELFGKDPSVAVVYDEDESEKHIKVYASTEEKTRALAYILPGTVEYGNVTLFIDVYEPNGYRYCTTCNADYDLDIGIDRELIWAAFSGNSAVVTVGEVSLGGERIYYVIFANKVVRYFNDDLFDAFGCCSTLYQDIAKRVLRSIRNVYYSTAPENLTLPQETEQETGNGDGTE